MDMKNVSLVLLTLQNCSQMLLMRFALVSNDYLSSTAVVMQEFIKLVISLVFMVIIDGNSPGQVVQLLRALVFERPGETAKMAVPGILYAIQNNLLYVAMANLEGPSCAVLYQLKILTTAIFSVSVLKRTLSSQKWLALVVLFAGAACVQYGNTLTTPKAGTPVAERVGDPVTGLIAVLSACCISGFAGVFLELKLKDMRASLWLKNVQLAVFGMVFGLFGVMYKDGAAVAEAGFFQGYSPVVWVVILDVSAGGLLVALVVKYADSIRKGFATTISILLNALVCWLFMDFQLTSYFLMGLLLVLTATFAYMQPDEPAKPVLPTSSPRKPQASG